MLAAQTQIRVRYGETDKMGVVYHGNYALYFEIGRTEALRQIGITYNSLEQDGVMMPVVELSTKFIKPAKYDDLLTVKTIFKSMPTVKSVICYEVYNQHNDLVCTGESTLVFVKMATNKICKCPELLANKFSPHFT